jgi:hypothetical protein
MQSQLCRRPSQRSHSAVNQARLGGPSGSAPAAKSSSSAAHRTKPPAAEAFGSTRTSRRPTATELRKKFRSAAETDPALNGGNGTGRTGIKRTEQLPRPEGTPEQTGRATGDFNTASPALQELDVRTGAREAAENYAREMQARAPVVMSIGYGARLHQVSLGSLGADEPPRLVPSDDEQDVELPKEYPDWTAEGATVLDVKSQVIAAVLAGALFVGLVVLATAAVVTVQG